MKATELNKADAVASQRRHSRDDSLLTLPPVLDACCASRTFWFDHNDARAVFMDLRSETVMQMQTTRQPKRIVVTPDTIADFREIPFPSDTFALVVFDPPHMAKLGKTSNMAKHYGRLLPEWRDDLRQGFKECFRVLRPEGVLVFKWCEYEIPVRDVLVLTPEKPLFGHISGRRAQTHWMCFLKAANRRVEVMKGVQ